MKQHKIVLRWWRIVGFAIFAALVALLVVYFQGIVP
jgi:hypothetical protein